MYSRRRKKYLLFITGAVILLIVISTGSVRSIPYHIGEPHDREMRGRTFGADVALFDDSVIHEINVRLSDAQYDEMIREYRGFGDKPFLRTDVTIDGVTVPDVGVRLKGNFSLEKELGLPGQQDAPQAEVSARTPLLIRFDAFVLGQNYQRYTEIAVRTGSDASLIREPMTISIHRRMGQVVPEVAYSAVRVGTKSPRLYIVSEMIDRQYLRKHFSNPTGPLYKARNLVGFEYRGDDPALYMDMYPQGEDEENGSSAPLIHFLRFAAESDDYTFERDLPRWIDMESLVRMMALDVLLDNDDSFVGMSSNYYMYYDTHVRRFNILSWDMNLGLEGLGPFARTNRNTLRTRFFLNPRFAAWYDAVYIDMSERIFKQDWVYQKIYSLADLVTRYNATHAIVDQKEFDNDITVVREYLKKKSMDHDALLEGLTSPYRPTI